MAGPIALSAGLFVLGAIALLWTLRLDRLKWLRSLSDAAEDEGVRRYDEATGRRRRAWVAPSQRSLLVGAAAVGALGASIVGDALYAGPPAHDRISYVTVVDPTPLPSDSPSATPTVAPSPAPTDTPPVSNPTPTPVPAPVATPTPPLPAPVVPQSSPKPAARTVWSASGTGPMAPTQFNASDFSFTVDYTCKPEGGVNYKVYPAARPKDGIESAGGGASGRIGGSVGHGQVESYVVEIQASPGCSWTAIAFGY